MFFFVSQEVNAKVAQESANGNGSPKVVVEEKTAPSQQRQELGEMKGELVQERVEVASDSNQIQQRDQLQSTKDQMSEVSKQVNALLQTEDDKKGIGQKIRDVAQVQQQSQERIAVQLEKMEQKQVWLKKMFGYDQEAVQSIQQEIEANNLRIQELGDLQDSTTDQEEAVQLEAAITALVEQNASLEDTIQVEMQYRGVWGWFKSLWQRN